MEKLSYALYALAIGALISAQVTIVFANPANRVRLAKDLKTIRQWLVTPWYRQQADTAPNDAAPWEQWRQRVTGDPNYEGRHHIRTPEQQQPVVDAPLPELVAA